MLIAGSILALVCGLANSGAAVLEKRESVRAATSSGVQLLALLVRRAWWLLAMALSVVGWVAEAAALALAPVPVVTSLRSVGRAGLVVAGHRWLGERFARLELAGVALIVIGAAVVTSSSYAGPVLHPPLANLTEVWLGVVAVAVAAVGSRSSRGLVAGAVVGVMFVATGVYTKEIGDRFAAHGIAAVPGLVATPGPWLMAVFSAWSIAKLQRAFRQANAASVSAANTTVSANGLIVAVAVLYHQPFASGASKAILATGVFLGALGALSLAVGAADRQALGATEAGTEAAEGAGRGGAKTG